MNANEMTFGVEIETTAPGTAVTEDGLRIGAYHHGIQVPYLPRGWKAERDGSIDCSRGGQPCEIVSPILRGAEGIAQVAEVVQTLEAKGHKVNITCGVHVHVGWKTPWSADALAHDDGGFTGGNMERPGLQRLLADMEAGKLDVILVCKVDRLSRSLMDFAQLVVLFEKHNVAFVSVTQRFDTTSSMGRLTLHILLSFAQFERELCSERVRDKIASAQRKGKYVGGKPFRGYDVDRDKMRLVINPTEADVVQRIFERFCKLGSCMQVAKELNEQGHRMMAWIAKDGNQQGGSCWDKTHVHRVLTNRRYIGEVTFRGQNYPGEQEAIIDRHTWDRVQTILNENRQYRASQTRKTTAAPLKGILRCGCCDAAMVPTYTTRHGKRYHYYVCHAAGKNGYDTCGVRSVPAGQIEGAVLTYLKAIFADPEMTARTFRAVCQQASEERQARERERATRQDRLSELRQAIGKLVRAGGDKCGGALSDELRALNDEYAAAEKRLRELDAASDGQKAIPSERDVAAALRVIDPLWEELFPAEKERIVHLLVESTVVRPDGLTIRLRPTGLMNLAAELEPEQTTEDLVEARA